MDWYTLSASASALVPLESNSDQSSIVNIFKLSKEWTGIPDVPNDSRTLIKEDRSDIKISDDETDESLSSWFDRDLQLWDRDKVAVVESLMNRMRETMNTVDLKGILKTTDERIELKDKETDLDTPEIVMSNECEILISWLDRYSSGSFEISEESYMIFSDNVASLLSKCDVDVPNFIKYLLDLCRFGNFKGPDFLRRYLRLSLTHLQNHAWGGIHLAFLNTKGIFLDSLISTGYNNPIDVVSTCIECADLVFPGQATNAHSNYIVRDSEYYFFIAYLLFRSGCGDGFSILLGKDEKSETYLCLDRKNYPVLFLELCEFLQDVLLDKQQDDNKKLLLGRFTGEYFPTKCAPQSILFGKGSNFYALLLLSIIYPDYYSPCYAEYLPTKEDYLWYHIHLMLGKSPNSLKMAAANLCHTISREINTIKSTEKNVMERVFAYAYSIALVGGIKEALRLLMSAVKTSCVQAFALIFLVFFESVGLFDSDDLRYIASSLWNLNDAEFSGEEAPYLVQLAFNRKRNVSPELKILLAAILPHNKAMMVMKYVVAENFNEAVNTSFLGSATTRNGMLAIGPLLQKLMKLSTRRPSAKYAILLLAQYSAHIGLWPVAFKCFYCVQDVESCSSVLEACCCYLYDGTKRDRSTNLAKEDLCTYFSLAKNLAPTNKRILELTKIFDCIKVCVLVDNGEYGAAVTHCKSTGIFENAAHILRNESHQIYFNALMSYIRVLKHLVSQGRRPSSLLTTLEASNLMDLLESACQNCNSDRSRIMDAMHMLMTFVTIVQPSTER